MRPARALGFPDSTGNDGIPADLGTRILEGTRGLHVKPDSTHVPSMLLDLQKGLPIEVEVIVGEVVRMAKEVNVEVPVSSFTALVTSLTDILFL